MIPKEILDIELECACVTIVYLVGLMRLKIEMSLNSRRERKDIRLGRLDIVTCDKLYFIRCLPNSHPEM